MKTASSFYRILSYLSQILLCAVFFGCSSKERSIEGSAFVVLKSQDVKKLAGMQINILDRKSFNEKKQKQMSLYLEMKKKSEDVHEKIKSDHNKLEKERDDEKTMNDILDSKWNKATYGTEEYKQAFAAKQESNKNLEAISEKLSENVEKLREMEIYLKTGMQEDFRKMLFSVIQISEFSAKTDADGVYHVLIPYEGDWVLIAKSERMVLNNTEKYYWIVDVPQRIAKKDKLFGIFFFPWSKPPIDNLVINNENMFSDSIDLSENEGK